ncbi:MAG: AraC family transcriptional regulator [Pseudomonadales bacterium]|nr:AraC family transcriptional regulator [Pseudomonadales bacterium]
MHELISKNTLRHQKRLACGLIPLLNLLSKYGVETDEVLRHAGIRKVELLDPAFTISFEQEICIVESALQFLPAGSGSLELAREYHLHHFSVLGLAIRACETLGDIFDLIMRYPRLVWGICETSSSIEADAISFELKAGNSREERFLLERDAACAKTLFSEALSCELEVKEVYFSHAPLCDIEQYQQFFHCPVSFGQAVSGLTFSLSELQKKVPTADSLSKAFYEAQCARISAEIDQPFRYSYLVRDYLLCANPVPGLEALSEKLAIEPRTLQRLLKKENTTFSSVLKDVRLKRACDRLFYSNTSVEEVALELGFFDAVAFSHAFKTWTGLAPRQWREQQNRQV